MGEEVVFTNCVFEKLRSPENTIFVVFSAKHRSTTMCWQKHNIYDK